MYRRLMKRALDVVLASMALIAASPLIVVIALAIRIVDGSPVLFRSTRVGRDRAEFVLLKFRTMPTGSPVLESSSAGELAITRTGRVLRRLSFDELPQLINVVKGDMSIVGPRPPLPSQAELIRLRVENGSIMLRPGMTGLAQIGRAHV